MGPYPSEHVCNLVTGTPNVVDRSSDVPPKTKSSLSDNVSESPGGFADIFRPGDCIRSIDSNMKCDEADQQEAATKMKSFLIAIIIKCE